MRFHKLNLQREISVTPEKFVLTKVFTISNLFESKISLKLIL